MVHGAGFRRPAVLPREDPHYLGEVVLLGHGPVPALITPNRIDYDAPAAGRLVVNQNAFDGWQCGGVEAASQGGLLAADVGPGPGSCVYRPPGLWVGLAGMALGLGLVVFPGFRRRVDSSGTGLLSGTARDRTEG